MFDSSDDAADAAEDDQKHDALDVDADAENNEDDATQMALDKTLEPELQADDAEDVEIDVGALGQRFFPDLGRLDELDVCPSLKTFDLGDPSGSTDIPFLRAPEDWRQEHEKDKALGALGDTSGLLFDDDAPAGFDDDDLGLGSFDIGGDVAFGEGGEAWARDAALEPQMRVFSAGEGEEGADGDVFDDNGEYIVSMTNKQSDDKMHDDILGFFDQALQKNWSSAEHWRIRKIKDVNKTTGEVKKRKEKEPFEIDFSSAIDATISDLIHNQASSNSAISMPKKDWKSKSKNLLPDDKHFSSKSLLSLFLKPKARLSQKRTGFGARIGTFGNLQQDNLPDGEMDEAFWANQEAPMGGDDDTVLPSGNYDANFFQDDALPFAAGDDEDDDLEFADAREHFSPGIDDGGMTEGVGLTAMLGGDTMNPMGAFGTTLVTSTRRVRPEYVKFARVAKKVDVRRLKEEMWRGMGLEKPSVCDDQWFISNPMSLANGAKQDTPGLSRLPSPPENESEPPEPGLEDKSLKFTSVMNDLQRVYAKPVMDDISTSFCFISLLHLANEKGLVIEKTPDLTELDIRKDWNATFTGE